MKLLKSKKTKMLLMVAVILIVIVLSFATSVKGVSTGDTGFSMNFDTFKNKNNMLCDNHDARFGGKTYYYTRNSGYPKTETNTKIAYLLAEIKYARGSNDGYHHYTQLAWWNRDKSKIEIEWTLNDNYTATQTQRDSAIYLIKKANAFATYRNGADATITNLEIDGNTLKFTVNGRHSSYGFGKITKIELLDATNNSVLATKTATSDNPINYGNNSFDISSINAEQLKVKVYYNNTTATATYSYYTAYHSQPLYVFTASANSSEVSITSDKVTRLSDVSLQKYIIKVNDADLKPEQTGLTDRKNAMVRPPVFYTNDQAYYKTYNINAKPSALSGFNTVQNEYKDELNEHNNVVKIKKGDAVTYRVWVYNNDNHKVSSIKVSDQIPTCSTIVSIYQKDSTTDMKGSWKNSDVPFSHCIEYTIPELNARSYTYFDITLKYDTYVSYIIANSALISSKTTTDYRILDVDFVKMEKEKYAVSLEKFVTKVNDEDVSTNRFSADSDKDTQNTRRYNVNLSSSLGDVKPNHNTWKPNHKVEVEPGDKVKFTIRLRNTGEKPVKITKVTDTFTNTNDVKLVYDATYGVKGNGNGTLGTDGIINFPNAAVIPVGGHVDVTLQFTVTLSLAATATPQNLHNLATIKELKNEANEVVEDIDGIDNNTDIDYLVTKTYAVSLQKFVQAVNGKALATNENRADLQVYSKYVANQKGEKDDNIATWNGTKWRNPVVVNKDDFVTYEIQVTNDGDTYIQSLTILDKILGEELAETGAGIEGFYWGTYDANKQIETEKQTKFNMTDGLAAGETKSIWITLKVSENNIALDTLTNHAEIENNEMKNKNGVDVIDTTKNNNADEDYIVLDDIIISGIVWNDKANGKQQTYNGIYDTEGEDKENPLEGIKVSLYRRDTNLEAGYRKIAETTTNNAGKYTFDKITLQNSPDMNNIPAYAKFIKAPKTAASYNYWKITNGLCEGKIRKLYSAFNGFNANNNTFQPAAVNNTYGTLSTEGYYAYYIEFEYDGIKYTTSVPVKENEPDLDPSVLSAYDTDEYMGNVQESFEDRRNFNNKFATITADGAGNIPISYKTNNTQGFVPESNYIYDSRYMAMKSSTDVIQLAKNTEDIEAKLQHVNMGLKGRDIFDLDISTNVYQTEVTVNGVSGVYQFTNEIHLRGGDIRNVDSSTNEDMTNFKHTPVKNGTANVEQPIRKTDINGEETNSNYTKTGLQVKVTYVLTIQNSSATYGTATQVTDYYDDKYDFVKAYSADGTELTANNGRSGTGYKSVVITTPGTELATSEWMDIYVELNLRDAENLLKSRINNPIDGNLILKTFNIAEIDSYKTSAQRSENGTIINSEFTRGLIDKNSAPGSINKETVRTTKNEGENTSTVNGNPTTLEYYYSGERLEYFKAENDTGAAPVLYFMASNDRRTLTGIVFEDKTITNTETRVKTGNGKLDEGENGVYGATVELVEIPATSEIPANIAEDFGEVRYQVETGANGNFTIEGFLPGNYLLRYRYGDTVKTALLHQNGNVNKLSYNGEDYQSTNNIGAYNAAKLNEYSNYWYIINETEGVSTGTDNAERRNTVRGNVTGFEDSDIIKLNNMKDLIGTYSEDANGTLTANKKYNLDRSEIVDIEETKVTNVNGIINATKMFASTPKVRFELEKPIVQKTDDTYHTINSTSFNEYNVENMNFGIAEVPVTVVKFNKEVQAVTIIDSTNSNVLAAISRNADGTWGEPQGAVITTPISVDIAIEEDKLQGAHLQATYAVKTGMIVEINFDESESIRPTITGMIDFIDNNLSYHPDLSYMGRANSEDWEIATFEELQDVFIKANYGVGTVPKGTVDPEGIEYTTIIKAKENNAILLKDGKNEGTAMITLERILSASDATIEETLLNTIDGLTYNNTVELTGITIPKTGHDDEETFTDRIRTVNGFIIRPGSSHDSTKAETIIIHPPTGNNSMNTMYFVLAIISLGIIAIGAFGIKRYVVNPRS